MPAVIWCAIGFVAGDLAGLLRSGAGWALGPVLAAAGLAAWRRRVPWAACLTAAAAGVVWGAAAAARGERDCRAAWREGERVAVVVSLWDVAVPGEASRARVRWPEACAGPLAVTWPAWTPAPVAAAVVVGTWHRSAARSGTTWPGRPARAGRLVAHRVRPLAQGPGTRAAIRLSSERRIAALFGPERAPLAAALSVGAGDLLDAEIRRRFARAGIAHILAISGLHVGILAAALLLLMRAARAGEAAARIAGTSLVAAYVFLLGFPAPAVRALGLVALWCWARNRQRPLVPYAALAATALVVVALDPWAVLEAGPWLSFAGAWGCTAAARHWAALRRERATPGARLVAGALAVAVVSGGATLATAPVSILAFGTMSPAALLSNVLAVPLAGLVIPALALTLTLAAVAPAAAPIAASAAAVGLDGLDAVARLAGAVPLASVAFQRRLLAAALLAAAGWMVLRPLRPAGRGGRGAWRALRARCCLACATAFGAAVWWPVIPGGPSGYRAGWLTLHFLAVGQGDAAVLRTPAGRWIVVDGGPRQLAFDAGVSVVAPFLRRSGAERVAVMVASHGDADHLGGLPAVAREFRPELVLEPGEPLARPLYRRWLAAVAKAGSRWRRARAGDSILVDGVRLRVLHPDSLWLERRLPANENSAVVALEYGGFRALLPGDAGLAFEAGEASRVPRVTLLKVAHHGSRTATGPALLAAAAPRVCVVSAGPNRYGLPDPALLAGLAREGCNVFRTDREGTVTVETDGRTVRVSTAQRDTSLPATGDPW